MNIEVGKKALITMEGWFTAPDGRQYKSAFGTVKGVYEAKEALGFSPGPRHVTWYIEIGNMTIAGCQVLYAVRCDECSFERAPNWSASAEHGIKEYKTPTQIYNADE